MSQTRVRPALHGKELILGDAVQDVHFKTGKLYRLSFDGRQSGEPVISNIVLHAKAPVNIMFAETRDVGGTARGQMLIELPENEIGMGSELVSCMPGFIASIFDVICQSAKKHTEISSEQIVQMVLKTVAATSELMLKKEMTFKDVVSRVATKGGITEEGAKVIYDGLPEVADLMFEKTLEKRKQTTKKAEELF